jgi:hypothetical protein
MTKKILSLLSIAFFILIGATGIAGPLTLPQLDPSQIDPLAKALSADVIFRPVEPASSYGHAGFSIGVTATATDTKNIQSIIGSGTQYIPAVEAVATVQIPFGLAAELGYLPDTTYSGGTLSRIGGDLRWTLTDVMFTKFPLNVALRGMISSGHVNYNQALSGGNVNVDYKTNLSGFNVSVSRAFLIFEPFVGYGLAEQSSTIVGAGTAQLFNTNFPVGTTSVTSAGSSSWFFAGLQVKFGFLALGAQYDRVFDNDVYSGRMALRF